MSLPRRPLVLCFFLLVLSFTAAFGQRQVEQLGRGVVAVRPDATRVYVGWRVLGDDPADIGFNVYRSIGGAAATKLNGTVITASTNYMDTPPAAAFTSTTTYYVVPVLNGVEQTPSVPYTLTAAASQQFLRLPLSTPTPNPASISPYDVKFCWVGDFDGDGEYDFLVDRHPTTDVDPRQYLEAYKRDGTFLWRMDMGPNSFEKYAYEPGSSAISVGDTDNVTVYDLDGDGKAEVAVRTANGVTVKNAAGTVVASITAPNNTNQFVSIINGLTGAELGRTALPNPWAQHGTLTSKCAIAYLDGLRPSVLFYGYNRADSGAFYRVFSTFDYRNGQLTLRWSTPQTFDGAEGHQIRIADVDNDGKDEICDIGHVIDDNGTQLFNIPEISHGDRFHIADINPDRPGLENYIIQQNNPSFLATAYYDAGTGAMIKKWYATDVVDVGRGIALDINSTHKGYEMYSTQGGIFNAKGQQIYANSVWAPEGLWWDTDLLREFIDGAGSGALNPVINKFNQTSGVADRLWSLYSDFGDYSTHQAYGGRPAFWGDILGDWREELILMQSDYTALRIYTPTSVATNRLYTLMHNPAYRTQATTKGYVQGSYVDYYLGVGMTVPPPPPMVNSKLAWAGGSGASTWNTGSTAAWKNTSTGTAATFAAGDTVRFDLAGDNSSSLALSGSLQPGDVSVYSPKDYTFEGAAGSLSGAMKLVKAGKGALRITGSHPFTGATTIWDGALRVDGTLSSSAVTVWGGTWGGALAKGLTGGRLAGSGTISQPVSLQYRGALTPGAGMNSAGTLTLGSGLTAADGSALVFDLSNDPTGNTTANDRLAITGNLALSGTVSLVINPLSGQLAPGTYTLATYTGSLTGSASNLAVVVPDGTPYTLALGSGALKLTVPVTRAAAGTIWTGTTSGTWDIANTANWSLNSAASTFVSGDTVTFNDTGAARPSVTLNVVAPVADISFSGATNYTISGTGSIAGTGGLTKSGTGLVTVNTTNSFTGPVSITGGILAINNLNDGGEPSSIGASPASAANFVINGGTLRLVGSQTNTNRALTLGSNGGTLDVPTASVTLQISGGITGSGGLTKTGAGSLILATANTYTGGTVVQAGTLILASDAANTSGLGSGGIILQGGTLRMYDNTASYNTSSWPVTVPSGASARWETDGRSTLAGTLSGAGTLDFNTTYIRTDITGNWSAFSGTLNVTTDVDGGDLRLMQSAGLPAAALNVAALTSTFYNVDLGSNFTYPLGALAGSGTLAGSITANRTLTWQVGAKNLDTTFGGVIKNGSGPTALTKVGTGSLTLTGANTYTGATTVSAGKLALKGGSLSGSNVAVASGAGFGGNGSVTGNVNFNAGSLFLVNPVAGPLAITGNLTFGGSVTISPAPGSILGEGTYPLYTYTGTLSGTPSFSWSGTGYNATFDTSVAGQVKITIKALPRNPADVVWTGATSALWDTATANWVWSAGATLFQTDDRVRFDDTSAVTSVTLSSSLAPASVTVDTAEDYTLSGTGAISGTGTLTKSGSGTLTLSNTNSYSGGTVINSGAVILGNTNANTSGLGTGAVTLNDSTLQLFSLGASNTSTGTFDNPLKVEAGYTGALIGFGRGTLASTLTGGGTLNYQTDYSRADVSGNWSAFSGQINVTPGPNGGHFRVSGTNGFGNARVNLASGVTLYSRAGTGTLNLTIGEFSGESGSVVSTLGGTGAGAQQPLTIRAGRLNTDATFAGVISGTTAVIKEGTGSLLLSGSNTYTGATTVSAGSLYVTGSLGTTAVSVASGATIGGTGSLGGSLTVASGARLALGVGASATKGLTVSGTSTLNGAITVVPASLGGTLVPGTYTLLTYTGTLGGSPAFTWNDPSGSGLLGTFDLSTAGQVRITLRTPLQAWRQSNFGTPNGAGNLANSADFDGDGIPNLLEYSTGSNPAVASAPAHQVELNNSHLEITFNRIADPALTYTVQGSSDLVTWSDLWTSTGAANTLGPVTVSDIVPSSASTRRFLRLEVSTSSP